MFKNIGDAWIKGMWARHFQMRGSGFLQGKPLLFLKFASHEDVMAKTLKAE